MSLMKQIPKDFYRVFRTKNREYYFAILVELYKANMEEYYTFGMTKNECRDVVNETMASLKIVWQEDEEEQEETVSQGQQMQMRTPAARCLSNLLKWGWLQEDYDEQLDEEIYSFPEYSQMFVELLWQLGLDSDSQERESILSIYSLLYTYYMDKDRNNDIIKNAWKTSRRLTQLLTNMQDGMRTYFDRLSKQSNFLGIQEVLLQEISNSDSKKYAMLTTTDSFYRYKEQVKELISQIIRENQEESFQLRQQWMQFTPETKEALRVERQMKRNEETNEYMIRIEREFDRIEEKYNGLIEKKTEFAKRALARVQFLLQEGMEQSENTATLIKMIGERPDGEEILSTFQKALRFSTPFTLFTEKSLYQKRGATEKQFTPKAVEMQLEEKENLTEFVPKPLYSVKELQEFREKNTSNGRFEVDETTVEKIEDLEKLMLLWQQFTADTEQDSEEKVTLGGNLKKTLEGENEVAFTQLVIKED